MLVKSHTLRTLPCCMTSLSEYLFEFTCKTSTSASCGWIMMFRSGLWDRQLGSHQRQGVSFFFQISRNPQQIFTSLKELVTCHRNSLCFMTFHDKTPGFVSQNTQISSMSPKISICHEMSSCFLEHFWWYLVIST